MKLSTSTFSLLDATPGQAVAVRTILFDLLREECARLGLRPGQTIRVGERTDSHVAVAVPGESTVHLRREWVRFIEVDAPH